MSEQEQEHWDHEAGRASEFQNSFSGSSIQAANEEVRVRGLIDTFVKSGQFVLVESSPMHCRVTDAVCGEHLSILSVWGSRAAAKRALQALFEDGGCDMECGFQVFPLEAQPVVAVAVDLGVDDGVPF
jgi:hypothetical protein